MYLVLWRLRILLPILKQKKLSFHVSQGSRVDKCWTLCLNLFVLVSGPTFLPVLPSLDIFFFTQVRKPLFFCLTRSSFNCFNQNFPVGSNIVSQVLEGQEGPTTDRINRSVATRQEQPYLFVQYSIQIVSLSKYAMI